MMRPLPAALTVVLTLAVAVTAHANTRRLAVIVGNNAGDTDRAPLSYAQADAAKFAGVLGELGGVAPEDMFVLLGKPASALSETFAIVARRIADARKDAANRVVVLFYFSGHSDGEALELGRDRVTFSELRRRLASLGADVRVALVDSCKSGALLAAKGGKPDVGFQIRLTDELASTGEVLLTSSAANEVALESREIAGSFFTHHFISGLRGAADTSGDGKVTLNEAYQYAYTHTIKTTGETIIGPQHPAYDYRLSGQGEFVLAELSKRTATLELPEGFERVVVSELAGDQVIAEVTADTHVQIAVPAGRYAIHASRDGKMFAGQVAVAVGGRRIVRSDELSVATAAATMSKGDRVDARAGSLAVALGARPGIADQLGVIPAVRAELATQAGPSLAVDIGSRTGANFRETSFLVLAGYRRGIVQGAWSAWLGVELGAGAVMQSEIHPFRYSGMFATGGAAGLTLDVARHLSLGLETTLPVELIKRDGKRALVAVPGAWIAIVVRR